MFGLKTGGARRKRGYPVAILLAVVLGLVLCAPAEGQVMSSTGAHKVVTCDTTAGGVQVVADNKTRRGLVMFNNGAVTIFVGQGVPVALTTANGLPILANASLTIVGYTGAMNCITASSSEMRVLEVNN